MNEAKRARLRLENALVEDKIKTPDGFLDVLENDLESLLGAYFVLSGMAVELVPVGVGLELRIHARAQRIKPFSTSQTLK